MAKMPCVVKLTVEDITIADVLEWLCRKADDENRKTAQGFRRHAIPPMSRRMTELPAIIERLEALRLDID